MMIGSKSYQGSPPSEIRQRPKGLPRNEGGTGVIGGAAPLFHDPLLYEEWTDTTLGMPGIQQMYTDLSGSITNRIKTIGLYKYLASMSFLTAAERLNNLLQYILPANSNFSTFPDFVNKFKQIALEKQTITIYLQTMQSTWNDSAITKICQKDTKLLYSEYKNLSKLAATSRNESKFSITSHFAVRITHSKQKKS
ncbi:MAG: hypothetical protein QXL17_02055 [Candidatus Thermoplasmatota archaeon]